MHLKTSVISPGARAFDISRLAASGAPVIRCSGDLRNGLSHQYEDQQTTTASKAYFFLRVCWYVPTNVYQLAPGSCGSNLISSFFQTHFTNWYLEHLLWNWFKWVSQKRIHPYLALVQILASCRQVTRLWMSQYRARSMLQYDATRPHELIAATFMTSSDDNTPIIISYA